MPISYFLDGSAKPRYEDWFYTRFPIGARVHVLVIQDSPIGEVIGYETTTHMDPKYRIRYRVSVLHPNRGMTTTMTTTTTRCYYAEVLRLVWHLPGPLPSYLLTPLSPPPPASYRSRFAPAADDEQTDDEQTDGTH